MEIVFPKRGIVSLETLFIFSVLLHFGSSKMGKFVRNDSQIYSDGIVTVDFDNFEEKAFCCGQNGTGAKILKGLEIIQCVSDLHSEIYFEGRTFGHMPRYAPGYSVEDKLHVLSWLAPSPHFTVEAFGVIGCRSKVNHSITHEYFVVPRFDRHSALWEEGKTFTIEIYEEVETVYLPCLVSNPEEKVKLYKVKDSDGDSNLLKNAEFVMEYNPFSMKPHEVFQLKIPKDRQEAVIGKYFCTAGTDEFVNFDVKFREYYAKPEYESIDVTPGTEVPLRCLSNEPVDIYISGPDRTSLKNTSVIFSGNQKGLVWKHIAVAMINVEEKAINCSTVEDHYNTELFLFSPEWRRDYESFNYQVTCVPRRNRTRVLHTWNVTLTCDSWYSNSTITLNYVPRFASFFCQGKHIAPNFTFLPCDTREECGFVYRCFQDKDCKLRRSAVKIEQSCKLGCTYRQLHKARLSSAGALVCSTMHGSVTTFVFRGFNKDKTLWQFENGTFPENLLPEDLLRFDFSQSTEMDKLFVGKVIELRCLMKTYAVYNSGYGIYFELSNGTVLDAAYYANGTKLKYSDKYDEAEHNEDDEISIGTRYRQYFSRVIEFPDIVYIICSATMRDDLTRISIKHPVKVYDSPLPVIKNNTRFQYVFGEVNRTLPCEVSGISPYNLKWMDNNGKTVLEIRNTEQRVIHYMLPILSRKDEGEYICVAENKYGTTRKSIFLEVEDLSKTKETFLTILTIVLLLAAVSILRIWKKLQQKRKQGLTEEEIRFFENGADKPDSPANGPYNKEFELSEQDLQIDNQTLGEGHFGRVLKGVYRNADDNLITVAVKTLKPTADSIYLKALLAELKIMISVGNFPHVVKLIGACTGKLRTGVVYIAVEYCANGSLDKFLLEMRSSFINLVRNGVVLPQAAVERQYNNMDPRKMISTLDLIKWSTEIALGMDFLSKKQVVHSDLAARNILLGSNLGAKVSDFGLSKQLYTDIAYIRKNKVPLPWRWMAIESLKDNTFSTKSDVWSYGVTLWEIFSLAQHPFLTMNLDEEFITKLSKGLRLPFPENASAIIYNIMLNCWDKDPVNRPSFYDLSQTFSRIHSEATYGNDDGFIQYVDL